MSEKYYGTREISNNLLYRLRQYERVAKNLVYGLYLDWAYEVKDLKNAFEYAEKRNFKDFKEYLEDKNIELYLDDEEIIEIIEEKSGYFRDEK